MGAGDLDQGEQHPDTGRLGSGSAACPVRIQYLSGMWTLLGKHSPARALCGWGVGELHTACPGSALVLRRALSLAAHLPQFSVIIQPLFESFRGTVSGSNLEELHRSALCWLEQSCSLPILRPSECSRRCQPRQRSPVLAALPRSQTVWLCPPIPQNSCVLSLLLTHQHGCDPHASCCPAALCLASAPQQGLGHMPSCCGQGAAGQGRAGHWVVAGLAMGWL